jgi:hypothetical protein
VYYIVLVRSNNDFEELLENSIAFAGIDFLEFRYSEIAAAVAISVLKEVPVQEVDKAITDFVIVEKVRCCVAPGNRFPVVTV